MSEFEGGNAVPSIFRNVYSPSHKSLKISEVPSTLQERWDWTSGDMDYHGYASQGASDSDTVWFIEKWTWTSGNPTLKQTAEGAWTDRASLTYS